MLHDVVLLYRSTKTSNSKFVGGVLPKFALLYTHSLEISQQMVAHHHQVKRLCMYICTYYSIMCTCLPCSLPFPTFP